MKIRRAVVVGAGTMGAGIAQVLIAYELEVRLYDAQTQAAATARELIARRLRRQADKAGEDLQAVDRSLANLIATDHLQNLQAELIIEAVPERLELKQQVFAELDRISPPAAILASNTSGLDISALAAVTQRPGQVIGMHFFNPPPQMPLIEVVRGAATSDLTFHTIMALAKDLGKVPIAVANRPGFVVNRILFPMINEAIYALSEDVATAADIDRAVCLGASYPLGPLALADFVGLDVTLDILEAFERDFADSKYRPCPLLRAKVGKGELGRKSGKGFFEYP